jgi:hypothetical protein
MCSGRTSWIWGWKYIPIKHSIGMKAGKISNFFALLVTNKFLFYYSYLRKRGLTLLFDRNKFVGTGLVENKLSETNF